LYDNVGPVPEPLLKAVSVSAALTDALRGRILSGEIAPGTALPEAEIAARFGVARPTVRTALQELVRAGLLRREVNRSAYVPTLSRADIADLYLVRRRLECDALRYLIEHRIHPLPAEHAVRAFEALPSGADWSEVVEADLAFHRALIEAVGSQRLVRLYDNLQDEMRLTLAQLRPVYDTPVALAAEHRALLDGVAAGDLERAMALLREHLDGALAVLAPEPVE
jgi:DNA-binding GntR family transcriptional regulator